MTERRYSEQEVAEIFKQAAETQRPERRLLAPSEGMTLSQLQEIGVEVGIAPELVARAALALEHPAQSTEWRFLGFPIGVGRTVELGRRLSDGEWERLVVDLRETFDAKGRVSRDGGLRQWTNGNLHVYVEPGDAGHRLRMRTNNGGSRRLMLMGAGYVAVAGVVASVLAATQGLGASRLSGVGILAGIGVISFVLGAIRLPGWMRRRSAQMEGVAERAFSAPKLAEDDS